MYRDPTDTHVNINHPPRGWLERELITKLGIQRGAFIDRAAGGGGGGGLIQ